MTMQLFADWWHAVQADVTATWMFLTGHLLLLGVIILAALTVGAVALIITGARTPPDQDQDSRLLRPATRAGQHGPARSNSGARAPCRGWNYQTPDDEEDSSCTSMQHAPPSLP